MTNDGGEFNEWVPITTLACVYETQLNVVTGDIRHRRQAVQPDYARYPSEITDAIAVERSWMPGHPPEQQITERTTAMYDETQMDHDAVFMHSATEAQLLREGRMELRRLSDDEPRVPFFKDGDEQYPGVRVGVHDRLEQGVIFERQSPPPIAADDLRFVEGQHDEEAGEPTVTLHCDKAQRASVFIKGQQPEEGMIRIFLHSYHEHLTKYTPAPQKVSAG